MKTSNLPVVQDAVMRFLADRLKSLDSAARLTEDLPVFEGHVLDSLSLVELVAAVETAAGVPVDMLRFDPSVVDTAAQLSAELCAALDTA